MEVLHEDVYGILGMGPGDKIVCGLCARDSRCTYAREKLGRIAEESERSSRIVS
jgi:hypothetical protein